LFSDHGRSFCDQGDVHREDSSADVEQDQEERARGQHRQVLRTRRRPYTPLFATGNTKFVLKIIFKILVKKGF
jgi:hypothetical protein